MKTSDFDYDLPPEYIAQSPVEPRDASRLMVLDRESDQISHLKFHQITELLQPTDVLVLNQTKVMAARLYGRKIPSGGKVELLLLRRLDLVTWETIVGGKGLKPGRHIELTNDLECQVVEELEGSRRIVQFSMPVEPYLAEIGHVPLPPYIHKTLDDPGRYQTVYARDLGSAAAPTAGLHFTDELMDQLHSMGVRTAVVTLHVGLDTFAPVHEDNPGDHKIHTEWCRVTTEAAQTINRTWQAGGRVIAVGTTSIRTLESAATTSDEHNLVAPYEGSTDLFILPGYKFRVVDAMITNFHLPRSTLIMLVSAFAGRERTLNAYQIAKDMNYRFYSFGDAMFIY